jgi:hypothetical protein
MSLDNPLSSCAQSSLQSPWFGVRCAHRYIDPTDISKSVPGYACRSLCSLTLFESISPGYRSAVPLRGHIDIFSSLPFLGEESDEKI